mmetsp:Transcript_3978/g.14790  ORF Transcript_3978/g.14790 Transcript_3978/m.14790 type:complete len:221 (+) Transcript_3978:3057-3719(+)
MNELKPDVLYRTCARKPATCFGQVMPPSASAALTWATMSSQSWQSPSINVHRSHAVRSWPAEQSSENGCDGLPSHAEHSVSAVGVQSAMWNWPISAHTVQSAHWRGSDSVHSAVLYVPASQSWHNEHSRFVVAVHGTDSEAPGGQMAQLEQTRFVVGVQSAVSYVPEPQVRQPAQTRSAESVHADTRYDSGPHSLQSGAGTSGSGSPTEPFVSDSQSAAS